MTKSDFIEWKRHPVTEEVFSQLRARRAELLEEISSSVHDSDPRVLSKKAGIVEAFDFLLNIHFDEESHGS